MQFMPAYAFYACYDLFVGKQQSDSIRDYARQQYIDPARRRGEQTVRIVAGEVHRALRLNNLVPAVCSALRGTKFLAENNLRLEKSEGPPSGMSTTVVFTYRIEGTQPRDKTSKSKFLQARGIAKEVFQALGGGEAFLKAERGQFYGEPSKDKP
jgi:hypothetical protein